MPKRVRNEDPVLARARKARYRRKHLEKVRARDRAFAAWKRHQIERPPKLPRAKVVVPPEVLEIRRKRRCEATKRWWRKNFEKLRVLEWARRNCGLNRRDLDPNLKEFLSELQGLRDWIREESKP